MAKISIYAPVIWMIEHHEWKAQQIPDHCRKPCRSIHARAGCRLHNQSDQSTGCHAGTGRNPGNCRCCRNTGCHCRSTRPATAAPVSSGERQTIKISGSTTVLPIVQKAADQYMAAHPNADIQVSGGGSGVGIQAIGAKTVDIGMSSREVTAAEKAKYPAFVVTPVAQDGIAVIVNPANTIQYITLDQIKNIYLGKITKWTEITGANVPGTNNQIVVIGRDSASGTRIYFDETCSCEDRPRPNRCSRRTPTVPSSRP